MTHRQRSGLFILGIALVLVAVVAGLRPHIVAGTAQAVPVPGPPAVGDWVVDPLIYRVPLASANITATSGGTVPIYTAQQIQPCTAARYAEVVSVALSPQPTVVKVDDAGGRYLDDPNSDSCSVAAIQYIGMTPEPALRFWRPYLQFTTTLSRPSLRQEAAGQVWVACIIAPQLLNETATLAAEQYSGSVRNALHTGLERNRLGTCIATADPDTADGPSDCGKPHSLEFFAFGDSGEHSVNRIVIQQTCRQLVHQLTAIPDFTAGDALSMQLQVQNSAGAAVDTALIPPHSNLSCGLGATGSRKLTSSLLAWGGQPIPWA